MSRSNGKRYALVLVALAGISLIGAGAVARRQGDTADRIRTAHERALKDPHDKVSFRALLDVLPKSGSKYIFEGDLVMSETELLEHLIGRSERPRPDVAALGEHILSHNKLEVDVGRDARLNIWPWGRRAFRYAIDVQSFKGRDFVKSVLEPLKEAVASWQGACPECMLRYEYVDAPGSPTPGDEIAFVVRFDPAGEGYFATAFFPDTPVTKRYLTISPLWYGMKYDPAGILRHEVGHTLGYRHEYFGRVGACVVEDGSARRLTEYDTRSVMQFFCGGPGTPHMVLTDSDKAGHRVLYSWHWDGDGSESPH